MCKCKLDSFAQCEIIVSQAELHIRINLNKYMRMHLIAVLFIAVLAELSGESTLSNILRLHLSTQLDSTNKP